MKLKKFTDYFNGHHFHIVLLLLALFNNPQVYAVNEKNKKFNLPKPSCYDSVVSDSQKNAPEIKKALKDLFVSLDSNDYVETIQKFYKNALNVYRSQLYLKKVEEERLCLLGLIYALTIDPSGLGTQTIIRDWYEDSIIPDKKAQSDLTEDLKRNELTPTKISEFLEILNTPTSG